MLTHGIIAMTALLVVHTDAQEESCPRNGKHHSLITDSFVNLGKVDVAVYNMNPEDKGLIRKIPLRNVAPDLIHDKDCPYSNMGKKSLVNRMGAMSKLLFNKNFINTFSMRSDHAMDKKPVDVNETALGKKILVPFVKQRKLDLVFLPKNNNNEKYIMKSFETVQETPEEVKIPKTIETEPTNEKLDSVFRSNKLKLFLVPINFMKKTMELENATRLDVSNYTAPVTVSTAAAVVEKTPDEVKAVAV